MEDMLNDHIEYSDSMINQPPPFVRNRKKRGSGGPIVKKVNFSKTPAIKSIVSNRTNAMKKIVSMRKS